MESIRYYMDDPEIPNSVHFFFDLTVAYIINKWDGLFRYVSVPSLPQKFRTWRMNFQADLFRIILYHN